MTWALSFYMTTGFWVQQFNAIHEQSGCADSTST